MKLKNKILWITLLFLFLPSIVMANEDWTTTEYTEQYKKWIELPEEERQNYIEPPMYVMTQENEVQAFSSEEDEITVGASSLPQKFIQGYYGQVKDQGRTESCWAQSAATVFETNYFLKNGKKSDFSALYMDYVTAKDYNANGFYRNYNSMGNMSIALSYATNGMGIVQKSMFSENNVTPSNFKIVKPTSKVSDYEILSANEIKKYVYETGAVSIYTYISGNQYFSSSMKYGNPDLAYYCDNENQLANHAVTIVGWDDNYTNSAFSNLKGAYVVLNSYGDIFGNNGLYYIFYEDAIVKKLAEIGGVFGITQTDDIDYDYLYQYDEYGVNAYSGYDEGTYAANLFQRKNSTEKEKLTELGIYCPTDGTLTIYINTDGKKLNINEATTVFTTEVKKAGYHTIVLPEPIVLANEKFIVCVKYNWRAAIEKKATEQNSYFYTASANRGESYISPDGTKWYNFTSNGNPVNAAIKVFTQKVEEEKPEENIPKDEYKDDLINFVFDYQYYAEHNVDIYNAFGYNSTALKNHWETCGRAEGRKASALLDLKYYVENNGDLAIFKNNYEAAFHHFMNHGYAEFRKSSAEYDGDYYRKNNADLKSMTSMQLIRHYSLYGKNEMRKANQGYNIVGYLFDPALYAQINEDVAKAIGYNAQALRNHWYKNGIAEGRIASLIFDAKYYLSENKDVAKAYGANNYLAAYIHFVDCGFAEGRQGSSVFSVTYYLNQNKDLKAAFGSNYLVALNHFMFYGKKEYRPTSSKFNVMTYKNKNTDIKNAYQNNWESYYIHYLKHGQNEKRVCI